MSDYDRMLARLKAEHRRKLAAKRVAKAARKAKSPADWTPEERAAERREALAAAYWTPDRRAVWAARFRAQQDAAGAYNAVMRGSLYRDSESAREAQCAVFDEAFSAYLPVELEKRGLPGGRTLH
jgi:hypothetical protein